MNGTLLLFSSDLELRACFPDGTPSDAPVGVSGVGLVDAALGTARLIARRAPFRIIFVGTCGAHAGSGLAIGDVIVAESTMIGSGDVARGEMRIPELLPSRLDCDHALVAAIAERTPSVRRAAVSCTLGITESAELATLLGASGGGAVENMEAFGVMRAAGEIPCTAVLGVTNLVGPDGGREWRANYRVLMRAALAAAVAALDTDEIDGLGWTMETEQR